MMFAMFFTLIVLITSAVVFQTSKEEVCSGLTIVQRKEWKARAATSVKKIPAVTHVFIHHTTGGQCSTTSDCSSKVRGFQNFHMDTRKWEDIGYSFLIGGDGKAYEGRGWGVEGAHTIGYNRNGIGISFIGDFTTATPSAKMLNASKALIKCGVSQKKIIAAYQLHGHRDAGQTTCPGNKLYSIIQQWPNYKKIH